MKYQQNYWTLVKEMAISDFKLRFHGSVLGIFWSFLRPLLLFGVLYLVFSKFVRFDVENYALYLLLGIMLWQFFAEATAMAIITMEEKAPLLKKIAFPRTIITVSITVTTLISLVFNLLVFFIFFFFSDISLTWSATAFSMSLLLLFFVTIGVAFAVSALYPKIRDIQQAWNIFLQLGFWLTPIIYPVSKIPAEYYNYIFLNPMARIIQYSRDALLYAQVADFSQWAVLFLMTFTILVIGYLIFKARSPYFAEEL